MQHNSVVQHNQSCLLLGSRKYPYLYPILRSGNSSFASYIVQYYTLSFFFLNLAFEIELPPT